MAVEIIKDMGALNALIANTGGRVERIVADGVEYGIYGELGTSKMTAWPFMCPAVEAVRGGFEAAFTGKITDTQVEGVVVKTAFNIERGAKERVHVDTGALKNSIHVEEP